MVIDPDLAAPDLGQRVITPAGMVLDGATDDIEAPPGGAGELDPAVVDFLEFYLLNYFKAGRGEIAREVVKGQRLMERIGCTSCHLPDLTIARDRRVANVETVFEMDVILRHGGEAQSARDEFETLSRDSQREVIAFLNSLVLFPPDDTASNLDPGDPSKSGFPQHGHGSIRLTVLFNNPAKIE